MFSVLSAAGARFSLSCGLVSLWVVTSLVACDSGGSGGVVGGGAYVAGGAGDAGAPGEAGSGGQQNASGQGGGPGGAAGRAGGAAGTGGANQGAVCADFIACTAATNPGGLGVILAAYGDQGNCWTQGQPTLCESACAAGLAQSHKAFPAAEVCNHCQTSADCPSSEPACDAATGACVACLVDSDCSSHDAPACAGHRCVACTQDAHCSSPQAPACNTATSTCVQCTKSADCGFFGEVCDPGSHSCRGCQSDAECPGGVCASGQCRQCKTDAQCGGATPRCNKNSVCVGCLEDSDCPTGACNPFTGLCCGAGACEKQGAECGRLIPLDLSCIFSTVSCGSCSDGLACVFNKCIQPPAQKCDSCSGTCAYVPETNSYTCANYFSECDNQSTPKKPCQNGFLCQTSQSSATGKDYSYCSPYCLEDADCLSKKCSPIDGSSGLGTCN